MLDLIDRLPRHSHLAAAQMNDPEYAALVIDQPESTDRPSLPLTEWSPVVAALAGISDRLGMLNTVVTAIAGKAQHLPPFPYPVTEVERLRERRADAHVADIEADVLVAQAQWVADEIEQIQAEFVEAQKRWSRSRALVLRPKYEIARLN